MLVGPVDLMKSSAMAFVRLAEGHVMENLTEVPLPTRFLFVLLGPKDSSLDYHEIGRSISTLMANKVSFTSIPIEMFTQSWFTVWLPQTRPTLIQHCLNVS